METVDGDQWNKVRQRWLLLYNSSRLAWDFSFNFSSLYQNHTHSLLIQKISFLPQFTSQKKKRKKKKVRANMAPTIHLVRHAQGYHNLSDKNQLLPDPDLTPLGIQQCADLRAQFPHHAQLKGLVASGMRRTLHTCINAFGVDELYPVIALDTLQECSDAPADTGSSTEKLAAEFGDKVDVSRIREGWGFKGEGSYWEPTLEKLPVRARDARLTLREIAAGLGDDAHIAVVAHGAFLHFLTEDWHGLTKIRCKICIFLLPPFCLE